MRRLWAKITPLRVAVLLVAGIAALAPAPALALEAAVPRALDYMHACQRSDGGFAEKGGSASSDPLTAWTMVAISAAGEDCNQWKMGGKSPADFLARNPASWRTTTDYARTLLAVKAAGRDPRSFAKVDLVAKIQAGVTDRGADGDQIGPYVNSHVWGMIALSAAGQPVTSREVKWLVAQQNADGGWGWAPGLASDTNDTAAAVEALIAAGQSADSNSVSRALTFIRSKQLADGGFAYSGSKSDADSTAWVVQALLASGQPPDRQLKGARDPLSCLRSLQSADGSVKYSAVSATNPLLVTVQAVPALCGHALPFVRPTPAAAMTPWKPTVVAGWPAAGATVAWSAGSTIRIDLSDGQGTGVAATGVRVKVDGVSLGTATSGQAVTVKPSSLTSGKHSVLVSATDRAGNRAQSVSWEFTVSSADASATSGTASVSLAASAPASAVASGAVATAAPAGAAKSSSEAASDAAVAASAGSSFLLTLSRTVAIVGAILAAGLIVAIAVLRRRGA